MAEPSQYAEFEKHRYHFEMSTNMCMCVLNGRNIDSFEYHEYETKWIENFPQFDFIQVNILDRAVR